MEKIDSYLTALTNQEKFSGAALIAKDGEIILRKAYGLANHEINVPNTPEMKYCIASNTKQFTAVAIMQLHEKELLNIHDPISKFIPNYEPGKVVTIHHLLCHTSGIPEFKTFEEYPTVILKAPSREKVVEIITKKPLDFEPGTRFSYSNSGYLLLTYIIEKVSGKSFSDYLQENIFKPLGMYNSGLDSVTEIIPLRASGYSYNAENNLCNAAYFDMDLAGGSGGIYTTIDDFYIWDQALYGNQLVSQEALDAIMKPHAQLPSGLPYFLGELETDSAKAYYGYGFCISGFDDRPCISHAGIIKGFSSVILRFPQEKNVIIILSNFDFADMKDIGLTLKSMILKN